MPRDLDLVQGSVPLTASPSLTEENQIQNDAENLLPIGGGVSIARKQTCTTIKIHPYTRPLTISDLESCAALENATFPPHERCSREKFIYRLTKCPELSLGLFCTSKPNSNIPAETLKTGRIVESSREDGDISVLLAHIVATLSFDNVVTDAAMDYPKGWNITNPERSNVGHHEGGRTVCVHSLGVLPGFQGQGLGRTLMTAYMQQMNGAGMADRIAIIAHEHLVEYYEKLGFTNKGPSATQFGGGGWIDLVFELKTLEARTKYG